MYTFRDISREAAARCLRVSTNTLDSFVHRYAIGGKRGGQRVFSLRDLVTLKTARNLSSLDLPLSDALSMVAPYLADEPPDDAVFIVADDGRQWFQHESDDWPPCNCRLVRPGQIYRDIKEAADVAI